MQQRSTRSFPHKEDELTKVILSSKMKAIRSKFRADIDSGEKVAMEESSFSSLTYVKTYGVAHQLQQLYQQLLRQLILVNMVWKTVFPVQIQPASVVPLTVNQILPPVNLTPLPIGQIHHQADLVLPQLKSMFLKKANIRRTRTQWVVH